MVRCSGQSNTEYRRAYKPKLEIESCRSFNDYRINRRLVECAHNSEAFRWESSDEEENENRLTPRPELSASHINLHNKLLDKFKRKQEENEKLYLNNFQNLNLNNTKNVVEVGSQRNEKSCQYAKSDIKKNESSIYSSSRSAKQKNKIYREKQIQTSNRSFQLSLNNVKQKNGEQYVEQTKHIQNENKNNNDFEFKKLKIPKSPKYGYKFKKVSKPIPRPSSAPCKSVTSKTPFIPYGYNDDEIFTGTKKTYNVLAAHQIYDSALRAQKRRQAIIEQVDKEEKNAPFWKRRQKALFNDNRNIYLRDKHLERSKLARQTSAWDTEYRNKYIGYVPEEFKRNKIALKAARKSAEY